MRGLDSAHLLAVTPDGPDGAGPDGDRAGGVGIDGRQTEPDQRGKREQRAAAGDGVDGSGDESGAECHQRVPEIDV